MKTPSERICHTSEDQAYCSALARVWRGFPRTGYVLDVPTNDDWHPTYSNGVVRVSIAYLGGTPSWRIVVHGGDDTYREKDFATWEALEAGLRRIPCPVAKIDLEAQGYTS